MKISKKLVIGLLIMLGMILASSKIQAITIWKEDVFNDSNSHLYCIDASEEIPSRGHKNYPNGAEYTRGSYHTCNTILAYIFASNASKSEKQDAVWKIFDSAHYSDYVGLYNEAEEFESFARRWSYPTIDGSRAKPRRGGYTVGPYRVNYTYGKSGGTQFGTITSANLSGVSSSIWYFSDANGNSLRNTVNGYPAPNQDFYITTTQRVRVRETTLTIYFDRPSVSGYYYNLTGTAHYVVQGGTYYCSDECRKNGKGCGTPMQGTGKDGSDRYGAKCGDSYPSEDTIHIPQPLIEGYGSFGGSSVSVSAEVVFGTPDLNLVKFITHINGVAVSPSREPKVDLSPLKTGDIPADAIYTTDSSPISVKIGDTITYTIRVYNEGLLESPGTVITERMPSGLEYVSGTGWTGSGSIYTTSAIVGKTFRGFDPEVNTSMDYADVTITCRVTKTVAHDATLTNIATINPPDPDPPDTNIPGPPVKVDKWADLSLRKYITNINGQAVSPNRTPSVNVSPITSGGTTAYYNHTKDIIGVKIGDVITYSIRVYSEGGVAGYATQITDHLPANLEYISDNPTNIANGWSRSGNTITTSKLANTRLDKFFSIDANGRKHYDKSALDYAELQVVCRVKNTAVPYEKLVNVAQISGFAQETETGKVGLEEDYDSRIGNKRTLPECPDYAGNGQIGSYVKGEEDDDDFDRVIVDQYIDLSLRKFITEINGVAVNPSRVPQVDTSPIRSGGTTANYNHTKDIIGVKIGDVITYTIQVYNEGSAAGYVTQLIDYLPANLEYIPENAENQRYGWSANGKRISTNYLNEHKLERYYYKNNYRSSLDYAEVKIVCRVKNTAEPYEKIVNVAEITEYATESFYARKESVLRDIDSWPKNMKTLPECPNYEGNGKSGNYVKGQEDDDDFERVIVDQYTDLALRKYISGVKEKDGDPVRAPYEPGRQIQTDISPLQSKQTTAYYNHSKEPVGVKTGELVTYTIRVTNEGSADGYANVIKDYLPEKLEYVSGVVDGIDYNWQVGTENGKTVLTTTYLAGRRLAKYGYKDKYRADLDYAEVKVICRVKEGALANEIIVNVAQITEYATESFYAGKEIIFRDIDSWPNNMTVLPECPDYDGNGKIGNYTKGQEDDDDFDRLKILYTDIGGTVWLDAVEGKQEERDNRLTQRDQRFAGVPVRLYHLRDLNTVIAETRTDANGNYIFKQARINGNMQNIPVNDDYFITFEYEGQKYTHVNVTRLNSGRYTAENSAGEERAEEREALNAKFYEIVKDTAQNKAGGATVPLRYTKDEQKHTATLIRDNAFYEQAKILARTEGGFSGTERFVKYINLGLYERAQVNLGLMSDVTKVDLTINGRETTYDYAQRDEKTAIDLEAKAADLGHVYHQDIYNSDYKYRIEDYNQTGTPVVTDLSKELEVYVTYKIMVKNYSSEVARLTQLVEYFTPQYKLVTAGSYYEKKDGTRGEVTWQAAGQKNGYQAIRTNSTREVNIAPNEEIYVYLTFQVVKDASRAIMLGEKYTVSEIAGFSTDKGLIDINSAPDNIDISDWNRYVATYEDDTDRAPCLNLRINSEVRHMQGFVWEDIATMQDSDGVKIGDGIRNENEEKRNDVRVQLIELVEIDGKNYEYIWQEVLTGHNKVSYMDRTGKLHDHSKEIAVGTGEYDFADYVPGNYFVRFKYGDEETEEVLKLNGQDYKSTTYKGFGEQTSSAKDNKDRRAEVMKYSIEQTNEKAEILARTDPSLYEELSKNTWMYADTVEQMNIEIKDETPGHKVNFGLLKRPVSKLAVTKKVTGIKISNKGIVHVDTKEGILSGTVALGNGSYRIELDDEILNGATLETHYTIQVTNEGEKDTFYNYFEGETSESIRQLLEEVNCRNQHEIVKTSAQLVYDYPEKLGYDETEGSAWTGKEVDKSILKQSVQAAITKDITVTKTEKLSKELAPGESTDVEITLAKIMAVGGKDDLNYSNRVEIVSRANGVGRRDEESILGNYKPGDKAKEPDTGEAEVTITDPTGKARMYYGLWFSIGAILIVGIILIQKKVLRNK